MRLRVPNLMAAVSFSVARRSAIVLAVLAPLLAVTPKAHAGLIGSSVTVTGDLCPSTPPTGPTGCVAFGGPETHTIASGGTNFTLLSGNGFATVNDNQLIWNATTAVSYAAGTFNGLEFQISGAPAVTSVSVDPATNLGPATNNYAAGFLLLGGNTVWLDLNGLSASAGEQTILDLNFGSTSPTNTPEPLTLSLFGAGLLGLGLGRRRQSHPPEILL